MKPLKVLLLNGSPHREGCTYTALKEIADTLESCGVGAEIVWLGIQPVAPCVACMNCVKTGRCIRKDDIVNELLEKAEAADGIILGSPVHYAAASGQITTVCDRLFFGKGNIFKAKPGAAIVSCRRGGAVGAFDQLNKYFTINHMPIVSSQYWNMVHGYTPDDVRKDEEGMQTMRALGRNMAWLLKCIDLGKENGITFPKREPWVATNFIR